MTTKEQKAQDEMKYDVRMVEYRLRKGELDTKEYEAFLKHLPNEEANVDYVEILEDLPADELTPHAEELTFT